VNVILARSGAGEGRKNDTMREGQPTDLERGEERRKAGGGRHFFYRGVKLTGRIASFPRNRSEVGSQSGLVKSEVVSNPVFLYHPFSKTCLTRWIDEVRWSYTQFFEGRLD
jgi:hypothetical protein